MYHGGMTETPEQRRVRLTIASQRAAAVRSAAALERLADRLRAAGYTVSGPVK